MVKLLLRPFQRVGGVASFQTLVQNPPKSQCRLCKRIFCRAVFKRQPSPDSVFRSEAAGRAAGTLSARPSGLPAPALWAGGARPRGARRVPLSTGQRTRFQPNTAGPGLAPLSLRVPRAINKTEA